MEKKLDASILAQGELYRGIYTLEILYWKRMPVMVVSACSRGDNELSIHGNCPFFSVSVVC